MGRGKVQLKRIENKINRQVTFSKRRGGLLKKAQEISILCDAEVGLIVFSHKGKLFEYASDSCMDRILEKYERYSFAERQLVACEPTSPANWSLEYNKLKARIELLERNIKQYMGEDLESVSMKDLQSLENQLDSALKNIRNRKNQVLHDSIADLQRKQKEIQEQNTIFAKKIKEKEFGDHNHWEQHNECDAAPPPATGPPPPPPPPPFMMAVGGGSYEDETRNELDLTLASLCSCHLGCFPA